jgi:hypothetical protein
MIATEIEFRRAIEGRVFDHQFLIYIIGAIVSQGVVCAAVKSIFSA